MCDLSSVKRSKGGVSWNVDSSFACTPPGTPPPPYHGSSVHEKENLAPSSSTPPPSDEVDDNDREEVRKIFVHIMIIFLIVVD